MKKFAVVDIGTNSARLMIAHIENGDVVSFYKTLRMIRVGEGMVSDKQISKAAMERAKTALLEFLEISKGYEAHNNFYCFATSAVRDAANKQGFLDYIYRQCGIDIDIISGDKEALLGFAGCVNGRGGMFDIGGGSTEVMFGSLNEISYKNSFDIGTVRFLQMFPEGDDACKAAFAKAHDLAGDTFCTVPDSKEFVFTGIGGTATALAAIDLGLKEYSAKLVQGHIMSINRAKQICTMLESKTKEQREKTIGLEKRRADVIVFGAIIMLEFMKAVHAKSIVVSDRDNQEGYLALKLGLI